MLISKQWLKEYVFLPDSMDPEELALKLKLTTVEVEDVVVQGKQLEHIVIGLIKKVEKHPEADRLQVCRVTIGNEEVQVVCGGSNVVEGMKVALAKIGARVLWHGEGEPVTLKETKIRGVDSFGMICGTDEIGLSEMFPKKSEKEILDVSFLKQKPGTSLASALGLDDVIFDIDNKSLSNRPDLWGHLGMAREIAAIQRKELKQPVLSAIKSGKQETVMVDVKEPSLCGRYMAIMVDGVEVKPSSEQMQKRLRSVGLRPINNIVDITNYVMLDLGQPLHAFDAAQIPNNHIVVRSAASGEYLAALDGKIYSLTDQMLVITNEEKPVALAGVIGATDSGVKDGTKKIILESANFFASSIRKTSQLLNVRTESSSRFEKALDPTLCELALKRAVQLLLESCPQARVVSNIVDAYPQPAARNTITISLDVVRKKIGVAIEKKLIVDILSRLGFVAKEKKDILSVTVPTWRSTKDVMAPEDLIEEIARLYGYEHIPATLPVFSITPSTSEPLHELERSVRDTLSQNKKFTEVSNYSFVSLDGLYCLGLDPSEHLELDNPIAKDRPYLRRNLTLGLLENVAGNAREHDRIALFELGRGYIKEEAGERAQPNGDELLPRQPHLCGLVFSEKGNNTPFFMASDAVQAVMGRVGITYSLVVRKETLPYIHHARAADIMADKAVVGSIFELHPAVQEAFGIAERVAVAEIDLEKIASVKKSACIYTPVSVFPAITRDVALVVDRSVEHHEVKTFIEQTDPLIVDVKLFDVYHGSHVGTEKKSMAYRITYQSREKTLLTEAVETIHKKVIQSLMKRFHATVRE